MVKTHVFWYLPDGPPLGQARVHTHSQWILFHLLYPLHNTRMELYLPLCQATRLTLHLSAGFNLNFSILSKVTKKKIPIPLRAFRISFLRTLLFTNHPFFFWMVGFLINLQKSFIIKGN